MSEVTHILSAIEQGDPSAAEQLLPLVYDELRRLNTWPGLEITYLEGEAPAEPGSQPARQEPRPPAQSAS